MFRKGQQVTVQVMGKSFAGIVESYRQANEFGDVVYLVNVPGVGFTTVSSDKLSAC